MLETEGGAVSFGMEMGFGVGVDTGLSSGSGSDVSGRVIGAGAGEALELVGLELRPTRKAGREKSLVTGGVWGWDGLWC